jgi:hypothetical protein
MLAGTLELAHCWKVSADAGCAAPSVPIYPACPNPGLYRGPMLDPRRSVRARPRIERRVRLRLGPAPLSCPSSPRPLFVLRR